MTTAARATLLALVVAAASTLPAVAARAATIPPEAWIHARTLTRHALINFGHPGPVATMAAQVAQESAWRPTARSPYAAGPAQFTPGTANWLSETIGAHLGPPRVEEWGWALPAMALYDGWLYDRAAAATDCDRWAKTLSSYNGGEGWVRRDERLAAELGLDPARWWGNVELADSRIRRAADRRIAAANQLENRTYPRRILLERAPAYIRAGYPGAAPCGGDDSP